MSISKSHFISSWPPHAIIPSIHHSIGVLSIMRWQIQISFHSLVTYAVKYNSNKYYISFSTPLSPDSFCNSTPTSSYTIRSIFQPHFPFSSITAFISIPICSSFSATSTHFLTLPSAHLFRGSLFSSHSHCCCCCCCSYCWCRIKICCDNALPSNEFMLDDNLYTVPVILCQEE